MYYKNIFNFQWYVANFQKYFKMGAKKKDTSAHA